MTQVHGSNKGIVLNTHLVVVLVTLLQTSEDGDALCRARLIHKHHLEPSLQGLIGLKVLLVLVQGSTADGSELTAGQGRLKDVGSIHTEIATAVDTIARLIGAMTIHLMRNTPQGDVRVINGLSEVIDIRPNHLMTRSNFIHWIVRTMFLEGNGNCVVYPKTREGWIDELIPIPSMYTAFVPSGDFDYKVVIAGREYDPDEVLHFVSNPSDIYPWLGQGYRIALADVADNLHQASATTKGFMSSKWKPSLIVKVDALTDEFSSPEGRQKLLDSYAKTGSAGEPWLIPAEQFEVQQVKPLSLSDLALESFVKLDKTTVASILGVPPFVLGVGEYKKEAWNSFIQTTVMPMAQKIGRAHV